MRMERIKVASISNDGLQRCSLVFSWYFVPKNSHAEACVHLDFGGSDLSVSNKNTD
jgi:hypothetical protein